MTSFLQDLGYAWRVLWKRPGFSLMAALTLALGIGANTAIFSVVRGVVLEPLPFPEPGRLVTVWEDHSLRDGPPDEWTGRANFLDWRRKNRVFEHLAAYSDWGPSLTGAGEPERLNGEVVSHDYFAALGVTPAAGRAFAASEEPGGDRVVLLGDGLWRRRFGADAALVGKSVTLDGQPYTVAGILPPGFRSPSSPAAEIWTVLTIRPGVDDRGDYYLRTVGRLRPAVSLDLARDDLARVAREVATEHPDEYRDVGATLIPLHEVVVGPARPALLALLGAVGLVLLIACANVANLLLARSAARQREMAVRASLGAGGRRIVRQLLTESLLLASVGGGLGLLLGSWGTELLKAIAPAGAPRVEEIGLSPGVLAFSLVLTLSTGVLFGLAPAFQASRLDLSNALQQGGRSLGGSALRARLRGALVVAEVAVALMLLVGAGLLIKSFWRLVRVDPGFQPRGLVTASVTLPRARYEERQDVAAFYDRLMERLASRGELAAAGAVSVLPLAGGDMDLTITIEGRPPLAPADRLAAWIRRTTPGYFETVGIRTVRGRSLDAQDRGDAPPVAMVNETLARRFFPGEDPIGRRLKLGGPDSERPWRTIVGIAGDVRYRGLGEDTVAELYLPQAQLASRTMSLVLAGRTRVVEPLTVLRAELETLDPALAMYNPAAMEDLVADSVALPRFTMELLAVFAALALALAATGVYGVMSYAVSRRTREIGVRMALGAERREVLRLVVSQGLGLTFAGLLIGLVAAFGLTRFLAQLLFAVRPTDPATLAVTAAVLVAVALLACYLPARRAARVDPVVSLRHP